MPYGKLANKGYTHMDQLLSNCQIAPVKTSKTGQTRPFLRFVGQYTRVGFRHTHLCQVALTLEGTVPAASICIAQKRVPLFGLLTKRALETLQRPLAVCG